MNKILELLKADILDTVRRPVNMLFAVIMVFGILFITGFVLNEGTTANIIASYSVFITSYIGFVMTSMSILTDKDNGLYRMYRSSRLSKTDYIISKGIYSSLGLIFSLLIILIGVVTTEINLTWLIIPILVLSLLAHLGIGLLIPLFVETAEEAQRIVSIIFFAMVFISPVFYTLEGLPGILQMFQKTIPLTYGIEAMRSVIVNGNGLNQIWRQLLILSGLTVATLSLGYRKLEF